MLQAVVYLGKDGRSANTPFINLLTVGICPKVTRAFSKRNKEGNICLALSTELCDKPAVNTSTRK